MRKTYPCKGASGLTRLASHNPNFPATFPKFVQGEFQALLSEWPVERPPTWLEVVSEPQSEADLQGVRRAVTKSAPYGSDTWRTDTARRLGLEYTLRERGRPTAKEEQ